MTRLLEYAIERLRLLPDDAQDAIANLVLEELESEKKWDELFAKTPEKLQTLANEAWSEHVAGKSQEFGSRNALKSGRDFGHYSSLRFKKLPPHADIWSVRVAAQYRAIGRWQDEVILWFFVDSHGDYDKLLERL